MNRLSVHLFIASCFSMIFHESVWAQQAGCPCTGGARHASAAANSARSADTAGRLRAQERASIRRIAVRGAEVEPDEYLRLVRAAHDYAATIAGDDDAQFTVLSTAALQQALAARTGLAATTASAERLRAALLGGLEEPDLALLPQDVSIWDQPDLQANWRNLLERTLDAEGALLPIAGFGAPGRLRIVGPGSREAAADEFTDCVCIGRRFGTTERYCCTGTLVGKNVVVTAGHCFDCPIGGGKSVVFVGSNIDGDGEVYEGTLHRHPEYGQGGLANDLSVIVLDEDVGGVSPRPIATSTQIDQSTFVRAVGFGHSNFAGTSGFGVKRLVDVPVASIACSRPNDPAQLGCDENLELVAGFVGLGPDSCNGDSGGPVYALIGKDARDQKSWVVAGATSRATLGATRNCGDGGIYVRLDRYLDFIKNIPGARF
jgi:hypothetical protein